MNIYHSKYYAVREAYDLSELLDCYMFVVLTDQGFVVTYDRPERGVVRVVHHKEQKERS